MKTLSLYTLFLHSLCPASLSAPLVAACLFAPHLSSAEISPSANKAPARVYEEDYTYRLEYHSPEATPPSKAPDEGKYKPLSFSISIERDSHPEWTFVRTLRCRSTYPITLWTFSPQGKPPFALQLESPHSVRLVENEKLMAQWSLPEPVEDGDWLQIALTHHSLTGETTLYRYDSALGSCLTETLFIEGDTLEVSLPNSPQGDVAEHPYVGVWSEIKTPEFFKALYQQRDGDNDGLPDSWEEDQFGSSTRYEAGDDPDRDDKNNLLEWMQNSNPLVKDAVNSVNLLTTRLQL